MVEDPRKNHVGRDDEGRDPYGPVERPRGSGIIFALVAIALILAIAFFYLTKDRNDGPANAVSNAANGADSAAYVVGDAARNAADTLRNRD